MHLVLEITSGSHSGRKTLVRAGQVLEVGRSGLADLSIEDDNYMSGRHFELRASFPRCEVADLESSNGTFVNGEQIDRAVLRDGDVIQAGSTVLTVQIVTAAVDEPDQPKPPLPTANDAPGELADEPPPDSAGPDAPQIAPPPPAVAPHASMDTMGYSQEVFLRAFKDEDIVVRNQAILAAAWVRQPWLPMHCRRIIETPSPENWFFGYMLAVLGQPFDLPRILQLGQNSDAGRARFKILGAFGHPGVVDYLLKAMKTPDQKTAAAAAAAFAKITGIEVPQNEQGAVDQAWATKHWLELGQRFARGTRWCRGHDLSGNQVVDLPELDMESRWEACLRGKFYGTWKGRPSDIELFNPFDQSAPTR